MLDSPEPCYTKKVYLINYFEKKFYEIDAKDADYNKTCNHSTDAVDVEITKFSSGHCQK